jgi:hypothetical protein
MFSSAGCKGAPYFKQAKSISEGGNRGDELSLSSERDGRVVTLRPMAAE